MISSFRAGFSGGSSRGKSIAINLLVASLMMEGAEPKTKVGANVLTTANNRDKGDAALVCQHHGHFEVAAVPPSPTSDGKGGSENKVFQARC